MSSTVFVSVIVPAFNAQATLQETLESVQAQTHQNMEILIIDDGSSDRTAEIAARFCATEPKARLLQMSNGGVASARNLGISEAGGEWIAPVDADDLWHPAKLAKQLAAAGASTDKVGFVYCWSRYIDAQGRATGCPRHWAANGFALLQLALRNFVGNGSALLLDRKALIEAGGYDEGLRAAGSQGAEDLLLQIRIAARHPIACVPEHLVGYRTGHSAMSDDDLQMERSWGLVFEALGGELPLMPPYLSRWARAARARGSAAAALKRRDYQRFAANIARALRLDPRRLLTFAASAIMTAVRRRTLSPAPIEPAHFDELAPDCCSRLPDGPVERLDAARLSRLAAEDARHGRRTA